MFLSLFFLFFLFFVLFCLVFSSFFFFFFFFFLLKVNLFVGSCVLVIHSLREIRVIYVVRATASARAARLPIRTSVCSISVSTHRYGYQCFGVLILKSKQGLHEH